MEPGGEQHTQQPAARVYADLVLRPSAAFRIIGRESLKTAIARYGILLFASLVVSVAAAYAHYQYLLATYLNVQPFLTIYGPTFVQTLLIFSAGTAAAGLAYHLLVRAFGGQKGYRTTLAVFLYAVTPLAFGSFIVRALADAGLPAAGWLLPVLLLWSCALLVIGIREAHGISAGRAAAPFIGIVLLLTAAFLALALLPPPPCEGRSCGHALEATVSCSGQDIVVMYHGGVDLADTVRLTAKVTGTGRSATMENNGSMLMPGTTLILGGPFPAGSRVVVTGTYRDGSEMVFEDQEITCSATG